MATKKENKLLKETLLSIARRYNVAYSKIIADIPNLIQSYYNKTDGWEEVQKLLNETLKSVNEFGQVRDYNSFYEKAYNDAIRFNKQKYGFQYNFSQIDIRALETLRSPQNWFVSKYQTLTDQKLTLKQLEEIWLSGKSTAQAAEELNKVFSNSQARINAYTKTTLATNNTRVRSTAGLNTFYQNGITKYVYRAVLDNVTTDLCEELNGREYSIKKALDKQIKTDEDVNKIINDAQRKGLADWQIYNKVNYYLLKNDTLATRTGTEKRPWHAGYIKRTANPLKQGKQVTRKFKNLESVPGNKIPRPPLHFNCRSRIEPDI